ncbi:phosphoribosylanthranilate isomerase [soil metagenome]
MHRTRIKICGITRADDALAAVDAGADAIGMILHANAPRKISMKSAEQIVGALPDETESVGVFVDAAAEFIVEAAKNLELDQVQLHGHESPEIVRSLGSLAIVKVIRQSDDWATQIAHWKGLAGVRAILLESGGGPYAGGNGIEPDWDALAALLERPGAINRAALVVAGGLRSDNVANVMRRLRPWSVDGSSGVETAIGLKSVEKMQAFCAAVRAADRSI